VDAGQWGGNEDGILPTIIIARAVSIFIEIMPHEVGAPYEGSPFEDSENECDDANHNIRREIAKDSFRNELTVEYAEEDQAKTIALEIHDMTRTSKEQLDDMTGLITLHSHPVLALRLMEHAGTLLSIFSSWQIGNPSRQVFLRHYRKCVDLFRLRTQQQLLQLLRFAHQVYVGRRTRRRPEDGAWNSAHALATNGTPWNPNPEGDDPTEYPLPVVLQPNLPQELSGVPDV